MARAGLAPRGSLSSWTQRCGTLVATVVEASMLHVHVHWTCPAYHMPALLDAALQRALQRPLLDAASPHPDRHLCRSAGLDGAATYTP